MVEVVTRCLRSPSFPVSPKQSKATPKHIGLHEIRHQQFRLTTVPLHSVPPFGIEDVRMPALFPNVPRQSVTEAQVAAKLTQAVDGLLQRVLEQQRGDPGILELSHALVEA